MISALSRRSLFCFAVCLAILPWVNQGAHAQGQSFSVTVTSPTAGSATATTTTGGSISGNVPLNQTLSASINAVGYNGQGTIGTISCYDDGSQIFSESQSGLGYQTYNLQFSWTPSSAGTQYVYCQVQSQYGNASTQSVSFTVVLPTPTLTVASSANPSTYGGSVTFTATISLGPTGTVTFYDSGTAIGTGTLSGTRATYTTSTLTAGTHSITAGWIGNSNYGPVTSSAITQTVNKATPIINWPTPTAITYGTALSATQLDASTTPAGGFVYTPSGGTVLSAGSQTLSVTFTPTDTTDYNTATSTVTLTVNKATPTLSVTSSANPSTYGQSVTFTATISNGLTGTVTFSDSGTAIGSGAISGTTATYGIGTLAAGTHTITASWPGNTNYNSVTSSAITQTVNKATPTLSVTSSVNPSTYGQSVTFTATISNGLTGTVTFSDSSTTIGSGTISGTTATYGIGTLAAGTHTITASWPGNTNYNSVTSSGLTQTVNKATPTLGVTTSSTPSTFGVTVTFTATISNGLAGMVTFYDGGSIMGTNTISGTTTTYGTNTLTAGTHSITASWPGNANYNSVTSSAIIQTVNRAATPPITWPTPAPITYGTPLSAVQLDASTTIQGNFAYNPLAGTILSAGSQPLSVTFTPNDTTDYNPAPASVTLTVNKATPTLNITWSPTSPTHDHSVTFTCTGTYGGQPIVNGAVLGFWLDGSSVASAPAASGAATWSTSTLTVGQHDVRCTAGDSNYNNANVDVYPTVLMTMDAGTVTLTINGVLAATTNYAGGATPSTIAEGLAAGVTGGSFVNVTAAGDAVYLSAKLAGAGTNYSYSLQTASFDSADFSQPSFLNPAATGSLDGGANAGSGSGQPVYSYSAVYDGAGNVTSYNDLVMGAWNFSYDTLNRLATSLNTQASQASQQYAGMSGCWSYDAFGNRTLEAISATPCTNNPVPTSWANYNTTANNNQFTNTSQAPGGVGYDLAGDVLNDGVNTYLYDGEGRICAVSSQPLPNMTVMTGYLYDAEGTRVAKGTITTWSCDPSANGFQTASDDIIGPSNEQMTEMVMDPTTNNMLPAHNNAWAGSSLIATGDADGMHFYLDDPLGSRRVQTDSVGVLERTCSSLPYGDQESCAATPTEHLFTGKERDSESGNDYFGARYYASSMGRMMSPDPSQLYFANPAYPQSLNLYSYGRNNPLVNTDPTGMDCVNDTGNGTFTTNTGDCDNSTTEKANAGHYIDCDGCTTNSTAGTLDAATGTLTLTDANGKNIAGTNVSDWAAPTGVSSSIGVNGSSQIVSAGGYAASSFLNEDPYANVSLPPATIRDPNAPPPLPKLKGWNKLNCLQSQTAAEYTGDGGGPQGASDLAPGKGGAAPIPFDYVTKQGKPATGGVGYSETGDAKAGAGMSTLDWFFHSLACALN
jgi:RHS repeat-associated protein